MKFQGSKRLSVQGSFAQWTEGSEHRGAGTENLAGITPVAILAEHPAADEPPAVILRVPEDTHGEDLTVSALDVEDVHETVVEQEARLAARLCFNETCDVFERRKVRFRQIRPYGLVAVSLLEAQGYIRTLGSQANRRPSVVYVEMVYKLFIDVEAGAGLVERCRIERFCPGRNDCCGNGFEEPVFREHRVTQAELMQDFEHRQFDGNLEIVAALAALDDQSGTVLVEKSRLIHCPFWRQLEQHW